jgi:Cof subfamily protein (haloacid dehalogenase superfamily)
MYAAIRRPLDPGIARAIDVTLATTPDIAGDLVCAELYAGLEHGNVDYWSESAYAVLPKDFPRSECPMSHLYVSDLDGTLLADDGTLSSNSRAALQLLLKEGVAFSVASARSVVSMRPILRGLRFSLPVIEFNGAFLSDLESGRHEIVNAIEPAIAQDIFALFSRFARMPFVSTFNGESDRLYYCMTTNEGERLYVSNRLENKDHRLCRTNDLAGSLRDQVVCLTVIAEADELGDLAIAIEEQYGDRVEIHLFENRYSPGWFWLTIHDRRATKDQAIRLMVDSYGMAAHELVVFGDQTNDIKMFRIASEAVAVANAHPEVKRHATQIIGPNHEDSVVEFIRSHRVRSR